MIQAWTNAARQQLRRRLLDWFRRHARDLPWRRSRDPYRVWVSEIMLQQTQVATVVPYYERFLALFPDAPTLASALEQDVLRHWEGLGYYRRARHLHAAAQVIVREHGGRFPRDIEVVRRLPGIGRYTAGAILSIAHDDRHPILEANTRRLYCRLLAYADDPTTTAADNVLWQFATDILPARKSGAFNQALMEIGGLICAPRNPKCGECPLARLCPTRAAGLQDQIPAAGKKMRYEEITETAVVVRRGDRVLVRQCGTGERWAGLWDFPRFALSSANADPRELRARTRELTGVDIEPGAELVVFKHGVTRFRITLRCHEATARRSPSSLPDSIRWVTRDELRALPLSVTGRRIAGWV